MKPRGTRVVVALVMLALASGCGESSTAPGAAESVAPSPTSSLTPTPTPTPTGAATSRATATSSFVANGQCLGDFDETTLPFQDTLAAVVARGRPTTATLCYNAEVPSPRTLDAARTYRALRTATTELEEGFLCPTDVAYGLLTLEYPTGEPGRLLVDGACPSVLEPGPTATSGSAPHFIKDRYAGQFNPYN